MILVVPSIKAVPQPDSWEPNESQSQTETGQQRENATHEC